MPFSRSHDNPLKDLEMQSVLLDCTCPFIGLAQSPECKILVHMKYVYIIWIHCYICTILVHIGVQNPSAN